MAVLFQKNPLVCRSCRKRAHASCLHANSNMSKANTTDTQRAIAFLQSQVPSTRQLVRKFSVHFLLEHFDRKVQHEELCALLQPLEWIARRLDRSVKRQVDIHLWTIRDEYERHPCGHAQLMVFASLKRESWRLKSLNAGIRGLVAESWQNHTCPRHTRSKEAMLCGW